MGKCPPIAAFCEFVVSLYTPHFSNLGAKLTIVSDLHLKYSRFLETCARDRARSALRGRRGSTLRSFATTGLPSPQTSVREVLSTTAYVNRRANVRQPAAKSFERASSWAARDQLSAC